MHTKVVILAKVKKRLSDKIGNLTALELQPLCPRGKTLNMCGRHPQIVYFDEEFCPCCKLLSELERKDASNA